MRVEDINNLNLIEFINIFGNVIEHFPKFANELYSKIPFQNVDHMIEEAHKILDYITVEGKYILNKILL